MERKKLNAEVKNIFTQNTYNNLKVFFEYIHSLNPDIIILIARKAICLFELINYLPFKKPNAEIVSDRVLDLDINYLKDKKVVIVDDTLIVGSSLKKIQDDLTKEKIDFKIVVFCVDNDNWQKKLIKPDYIQEHFSSREVLDFCINEVKAFSLISKPYLIDFPITNFVQCKFDEFQRLISDKRFDYIVLPTQNNTYLNDIYTVLLKDSIRDDYYLTIGKSYKNIIETLKLRIFISNDDKLLNLRIVPIVLLKHLKEETITIIFDFLISQSIYKEEFYKFINKTPSKIRFIQYYLSIMLGKIYFSYIEKVITNIHELHFKSSEIINLFGKDLGKKFEHFFLNEEIDPLITELSPSKIKTEKIFLDLLESVQIKGYNIVESFQNVFVEMYHEIELSARTEIKNGQFNTKNLQRLKKGISFSAIVNHFTKKLNIEINETVIEYFSICLDITNDLGISVPIICNYNDIYYRGYRYGELGTRSKGNIYLLFRFFENFCLESKIDISEGLPKLLVEKLTVLFYRVGARKEFLDITYNNSDPEAVNMGFYLMGSIMIENTQDFFPIKREEWFLNNSCSNLLKYDPKSEKYYLNKVPKEDVPLKRENEAIYLGLTVGKLFYQTGESELKKSSGLTTKDLAILVSCYSVGDLAMAIAAELNIMISWIKIAEYCLRKTSNPITLSIFANFHTTNVYQSFNQAFLKIKNSFGAYTNVKKMVENTKYYLNNNFGPMYSKHWDDYVRNLKIGKEDIFSFKMDKDRDIVKYVFDAANRILMLGNYFHYIRFLLEINNSRNNPTISMNSVFSFLELKSNKMHKRKIVDKFIKDNSIIKGYELGYRSKIARAFEGKKINDTLTIKHDKVIWKFKIIDIDNSSIIHNTVSTFDNYNNNIRALLQREKYLRNYLFLPTSYNLIKKQIDNFRYYSPQHLNGEIAKIIKILNKEIPDVEIILSHIKETYKRSRDNIANQVIY